MHIDISPPMFKDGEIQDLEKTVYQLQLCKSQNFNGCNVIYAFFIHPSASSCIVFCCQSLCLCIKAFADIIYEVCLLFVTWSNWGLRNPDLILLKCSNVFIQRVKK